MGRARGPETAGRATPIRSARRPHKIVSDRAGAADDITTETRTNPQAEGGESPAIFLRLAGSQFAVTVEPSAPDGVPALQIFETYKAARGTASGLRLIHRLPIVDQVERGALV